MSEPQDKEVEEILLKAVSAYYMEVRRYSAGLDSGKPKTAIIDEATHAIKQLINRSNTEYAIKELERVMEIPGSAFVGNGQSEIHWQTHNRIEQLKSKLEKGL